MHKISMEICRKSTSYQSERGILRLLTHTHKDSSYILPLTRAACQDDTLSILHSLGYEVVKNSLQDSGPPMYANRLVEV